ncbi:DNA/RNA non-specific endonuclease [Winogradskyella undariae]|uniref:DNA/RNA non-specific endonuclease n=1 Tax=Winogradskyella TaxID=286104 RepID=UPI00156B369A|nr:MULTISPECIES: DNA/RNA non-specific endonuclease [Winogradskyella]NRR91613.1 DNA/RNA non-specific endonuclease [Winogradskyella undariae]QXP77828.1 DNA/RNA non-specific endonuclease [Winogradskyella sp. HaHa_3_26]
MKRKPIYTIIAVIIVIGIYSYDFFIEQKAKEEVITEGEIVKENTNEFYLPTSTTNQIVHHQNYSLSYSEPHEQAEWVAYELKLAHLSSTNRKRPYFEIDAAVKTGAGHWNNYKKSGYDKGHLCPAGDRRFTKAAHDETFLTSNISPQEHQFNAGVWNRLEQKVRYWAKKNDGIFVVTGGVLKDNLKTIGDENVAVPNQFYKVILDNTNGKIKMLAFLMDHENSNLPLYKFVVSVDSLETLTGIDFFPELEDRIENKLEASASYKSWSF